MALRSCPVATMARPTVKPRAGIRLRSSTATARGGSAPDSHIAARPSTHSVARTARPVPLTGSVSVHTGTAVSRKPATAAMAKPNSISWPCQYEAGRAPPMSRTPR